MTASTEEISMNLSTENAATPKSTKSRHSDSSVKIQIKPTFDFEFVPRDTEKSEILDLVDVGGVTISAGAVIPDGILKSQRYSAFV